jgi:hypothetical protein
MTRLASRLPIAAALLLACVIDAIMTEPASAHVKWFCAFDVAGQPIGLVNVLCPDFELLTGLSLLGLMTGSALDVTPLGGAIQRALNQATSYLRENIEIIFRAACAFFFISIWALGGILLTPELKTNSPWVAAIQLGIAAGMLSRRTMPFSALGIVAICLIACCSGTKWRKRSAAGTGLRLCSSTSIASKASTIRSDTRWAMHCFVR